MSNDLISREDLKKAIEQYQIQWNKNCETDIAHWDSCECILAIIDNAPTVELDECVIQEVLNKRCMTVVANEYLIALHDKRPHGTWQEFKYGLFYCSKCFESVGSYIERIERLYQKQELGNYCPCCGADMRLMGAAE